MNRLGLDARPAAMFVRIASRYRSEVWVEKEGERINGKSIMGLMMLAAGQGSKLHIRCEGPDADRAMQELEELIKKRFNEDCWDSESQRCEQGPTSLWNKFSEIKYAINNALADGDYIVQERVPTARETFPALTDDGRVEFAEQLVDLDPLLFNGRVGSAFTRLSFTELANVSSGGGMVPTYIVSKK